MHRLGHGYTRTCARHATRGSKEKKRNKEKLKRQTYKVDREKVRGKIHTCKDVHLISEF